MLFVVFLWNSALQECPKSHIDPCCYFLMNFPALCKGLYTIYTVKTQINEREHEVRKQKKSLECYGKIEEFDFPDYNLYDLFLCAL